MKRILKSSLLVIIAANALFSCTSGNKIIEQTAIPFEKLDSLIEIGNLKEATNIINQALVFDSLTADQRYKLNFDLDKIERIKGEFNIEKEQMLEYIKKYLPNVTDTQIDEWIAKRALEAKEIDGKLMFFKKGPHNLFLIDSIANKAYVAVEGEEVETSDFLQKYLPDVIPSLKSSASSYGKGEKMRVTVRMRVFPQAAPSGEIIRVWLPYIHAQHPKYKDVKLINVYRSDGGSDYLISPGENLRQSIYFEMKANGTDTLKVGYTLEFTSYNQYFANLEKNIKPYDTTSTLYKKYTSEREQHIIFTPKIRELTAQVVGEEQNPYLKVKRIWEYIDKTIPWAGARDYSTIPNIPMYVLENGHGDCGQVTLLFMTMARIAGVPCKWQSGWMLHPEHLNLHDWAEVYYEGVGWVPVDQSFGHIGSKENSELYYFYTKGLDAYRYIVNEEYGKEAPLYPSKIYPHFDEVDFQMGEVEWRGGNIYNGSNGWRCWMDIEYLN